MLFEVITLKMVRGLRAAAPSNKTCASPSRGPKPAGPLACGAASFLIGMWRACVCNMCVHVFVRACVCMCLYVHVCALCVCVCACLRAHMLMRMRVRCACEYVLVCVRACTCMYDYHIAVSINTLSPFDSACACVCMCMLLCMRTVLMCMRVRMCFCACVQCWCACVCVCAFVHAYSADVHACLRGRITVINIIRKFWKDWHALYTGPNWYASVWRRPLATSTSAPIKKRSLTLPWANAIALCWCLQEAARAFAFRCVFDIFESVCVCVCACTCMYIWLWNCRSFLRPIGYVWKQVCLRACVRECMHACMLARVLGVHLCLYGLQECV